MTAVVMGNGRNSERLGKMLDRSGLININCRDAHRRDHLQVIKQTYGPKRRHGKQNNDQNSYGQ